MCPLCFLQYNIKISDVCPQSKITVYKYNTKVRCVRIYYNKLDISHVKCVVGTWRFSHSLMSSDNLQNQKMSH